MAGALDGVRVLEFASYVAGPYAGMMLADLWADVIKSEQPGAGDPFRDWGDGGYSPTFEALNRNKKSVAVDLKTEPGRLLAHGLLADADELNGEHFATLLAAPRAQRVDEREDAFTLLGACLFDDVGDLVERVLHRVELIADRGANGAQRRVQLVGHTGYQLAQCREFLGLYERMLRRFDLTVLFG